MKQGELGMMRDGEVWEVRVNAGMKSSGSEGNERRDSRRNEVRESRKSKGK